MQPARNLRDIIPAFFTGPGGERLTPEQIKRRQEVAQSLIARATDTRPDAGGWASVLTKGLLGYQSGRDQRIADEATRANAEANQALMSDMLQNLGGGAAYPAPVAMGASPTSGIATGTVPSVPSAPVGDSILPQGFLSALDRTEGAGSYDTLFGHAQNNRFAGTNVSGMTIGEALAFADPKGPYAQHVKSQVGRVATPLGRHQIVGTTLRNAAKEMGLDLNTPFNQQTQDAIALHLAKKRVGSANTMQGKMNALRSEWEGFRNIPDAQLAQIVQEIEGASIPAVTAQAAIQDIAPIEQGDENPMVNVPATPEGTQYVDPLVAPYDGRGSRVFDVTNMPEISTAPNMQFNQENFDQRFGSPSPVPAPEPAPAPQPAIDESLLAQHDAMWGGALSPTGVSPVAQALTGYFPEAPSVGSAPAMAQTGGVNPAVIQALADPYASPETRQVASLLLGQQFKAQQEAQAQQQAMQQRGVLAQSMGIDPNLAMNADDTTWKAMVDQTYRASPSAIQEYEYARGQGYQGSFSDYQLEKQRAGSTTVNVGDGAPGLGKLSSDFGYVLDPETRQPIIGENGLPIAAPIPGSPAARQIEEEQRSKDAGKRNAADYARTVVQDVGIAGQYLASLDGVRASDGVFGANMRKTMSSVPGSPEYNMKQFVESALSNVTLDTMNRMRETSAAGATGMGNMSDKQLKVIQGVLGQWDPGLPIKDQQLILKRLRNFYLDVQYGSDQERKQAIADGRMTKDEDDAIRQLYELEWLPGGDGGPNRTSSGVTWSVD